MANKNLQGIKKFKFFNEEKIEDADKNQKFLSYNLNHLTPTTLRIYDKY